MTFSSYKNHNTYKASLGISPGGAVIFISKLFSGWISDKQPTSRSGLLKLLGEGDSIMADGGFIYKRTSPQYNRVKLNMPPFMKGRKQP